MVVEHFAKLNPQPELCIFQHVQVYSDELSAKLNKVSFDKYAFTDCTESSCLVAYNKKLLSITCTKEQQTNLIVQCNGITKKPSFKLVILSNAGQPHTKELAKKCFKELSREATSECPVLLVGRFYVDLFRVELHAKENIRHDFEVPEYSPTMYRMTHPYNTRDLYICRDFFTFRNYMGATNYNTTTVRISDVQVEMINPPQDLIRGSYNVNYDLIRDVDKVIEVLKGILFITSPTIPTSSGLPPYSESLVSYDSDSDSTPKNTSSGSKPSNSASSDDKIHHHKTKVSSTAKSQKRNSKKKDSSRDSKSDPLS